MRLARTAAAASLTAAVLTMAAGAVCPGTASAAVQPGPTQVVNDLDSAAAVVIKDNAGRRFHLRRGGYVLHESDKQFFTTFYVARGTTTRFYATDPYGDPMPGVLQEEPRAGWHQTNAQVDDADLVLIKVYATTVAATRRPPNQR